MISQTGGKSQQGIYHCGGEIASECAAVHGGDDDVGHIRLEGGGVLGTLLGYIAVIIWSE